MGNAFDDLGVVPLSSLLLGRGHGQHLSFYFGGAIYANTRTPLLTLCDGQHTFEAIGVVQ